MHRKRQLSLSKTYGKRDSGLLNTLINKVLFELHIPGYQFCEPETKLQRRLSTSETEIKQNEGAVFEKKGRCLKKK